jgi:hypothetical protein
VPFFLASTVFLCSSTQFASWVFSCSCQEHCSARGVEEVRQARSARSSGWTYGVLTCLETATLKPGYRCAGLISQANTGLKPQIGFVIACTSCFHVPTFMACVEMKYLPLRSSPLCSGGSWLSRGYAPRYRRAWFL